MEPYYDFTVLYLYFNRLFDVFGDLVNRFDENLTELLDIFLNREFNSLVEWVEGILSIDLPFSFTFNFSDIFPVRLGAFFASGEAFALVVAIAVIVFMAKPLVGLIGLLLDALT